MMHCGYFDTTQNGSDSSFLTPTLVGGWRGIQLRDGLVLVAVNVLLKWASERCECETTRCEHVVYSSEIVLYLWLWMSCWNERLNFVSVKLQDVNILYTAQRSSSHQHRSHSPARGRTVSCTSRGMYCLLHGCFYGSSSIDIGDGQFCNNGRLVYCQFSGTLCGTALYECAFFAGQVYHTPHITGHFGDESFQAINCTGTDHWKQWNKTMHALETQKNKHESLP